MNPSENLSNSPGRMCPIDYYYGAAAIADAPTAVADCAWIVGGLYGNPFALDVIEQAFDAEASHHKRLIFNGDFHWFDAEPEWFARIQNRVLQYDALRGNVETECSRTAYDLAIGCGCAYPSYVDDEVVNRSNRILGALWQACDSGGFAAALQQLPQYRHLEIGDARIAVVHGDLDSLAGWTFDTDALSSRLGLMKAGRMLSESAFDIVACSHTCAPVLRRFEYPGEEPRTLVNNGAAGMPNFRNDLGGVVTRISEVPLSRIGEQRLQALRLRVLHERQQAGVWVESIAIDYDPEQWWQLFSSRWPPGSDAEASYGARIQHGCSASIQQAYPSLAGRRATIARELIRSRASVPATPSTDR
jgi:predicted phosphodiesterase